MYVSILVLIQTLYTSTTSQAPGIATNTESKESPEIAELNKLYKKEMDEIFFYSMVKDIKWEVTTVYSGNGMEGKDEKYDCLNTDISAVMGGKKYNLFNFYFCLYLNKDIPTFEKKEKWIANVCEEFFELFIIFFKKMFPNNPFTKNMPEKNTNNNKLNMNISYEISKIYEEAPILKHMLFFFFYLPNKNLIDQNSEELIYMCRDLALINAFKLNYIWLNLMIYMKNLNKKKFKSSDENKIFEEIGEKYDDKNKSHAILKELINSCVKNLNSKFFNSIFQRASPEMISALSPTKTNNSFEKIFFTTKKVPTVKETEQRLEESKENEILKEVSFGLKFVSKIAKTMVTLADCLEKMIKYNIVIPNPALKKLANKTDSVICLCCIHNEYDNTLDKIMMKKE